MIIPEITLFTFLECLDTLKEWSESHKFVKYTNIIEKILNGNKIVQFTKTSITKHDSKNIKDIKDFPIKISDVFDMNVECFIVMLVCYRYMSLTESDKRKDKLFDNLFKEYDSFSKLFDELIALFDKSIGIKLSSSVDKSVMSSIFDFDDSTFMGKLIKKSYISLITSELDLLCEKIGKCKL